MRNILAILFGFLMLASGAAFAGEQGADASKDKKAAPEQLAPEQSTTDQSTADADSTSDDDQNAGDSE